MLREYSADLHIHSCLSPFASLDLSPREIVERAKTESLDIIAITDHSPGAGGLGVESAAETQPAFPAR